MDRNDEPFAMDFASISFPYGLNPLHYASFYGNLKWVRFLVDHYDVNQPTEDGKQQTAVMLAAKGGYLHCVKFLIESKANVALLDNEGHSCKDLCSIKMGKGCLRAIQLGLEGKVDKRVQSSDGRWRTQRILISELENEKQVPPACTQERSSLKTPVNWNELIHPLQRNWIKSSEISSAKGSLLRIVSYNILAQCYTKPNYFPWASSGQLDWKFRLPNIVQEMLSYNADVICLQEVDHYYDLKEHLMEYNSVYKQRTGRRTEGCAIFFKKNLFELVETKSVEYNHFTQESRLKKDNIALYMALRGIHSNQLFSVGTTHLYYKSAQAREQQAKCFITQGKEFANNGPLILCGDFNCPPACETIERFYTASLECGFSQLIARDAYCTFLGGKNAKKWYDYIFHSRHFLSKGVLSLPKHGSSLLPNYQLSSDHVALVEDLLLLN